MTAPLLFALEEYPQLRELIGRGLTNTEDIDAVRISNSNDQLLSAFFLYMMST